jgi:transcription termination factor 2
MFIMLQGMLFSVKWDRVILDEAHQVRNPKTKMAKGVCNLHSNFRWALTGTPIHNKLLDLYSLIKFLNFTPFNNEQVSLIFMKQST